MSEMNPPVLEKSKIIKATLLSLLIGAVILVVAVLPAEYGIDPTGAGKVLGFSRLYVPHDQESTTELTETSTSSNPIIKLEDAGSAAHVIQPDEANNPAPLEQLSVREDDIEVVVPAGKGIEFKVHILKHGKMKYEWTTANREIIYFDFHGEVKQEKKPEEVFYESYTITYSNNVVGTFLAPFEGIHGWYFKNTTDQDIVVNFRLKGEYVL